jgi:hypothetical protein
MDGETQPDQGTEQPQTESEAGHQQPPTWTRRVSARTRRVGPVKYERVHDDAQGRLYFKFSGLPPGRVKDEVYEVMHAHKKDNGMPSGGLRFVHDSDHGEIWTLASHLKSAWRIADRIDLDLHSLKSRLKQEQSRKH